MTFPTAARVLNGARPDNAPPFSDARLLACCERCNAQRRLSECRQEETESARNYRCAACNEILVIIRSPTPGGIPVPDSGYRIKDWVFANPVDVFVEGLPLVFDAKRNATSLDIRLQNMGGIDDTTTD